MDFTNYFQSPPPKNIIYKTGDIMDATEQYILVDCDCISRSPSANLKKLYEKFPYANIY